MSAAAHAETGVNDAMTECVIAGVFVVGAFILGLGVAWWAKGPK